MNLLLLRRGFVAMSVAMTLAAQASAQDTRRSHGFWVGGGPGAGSIGFICDSCNRLLTEGRNGPRLGGWMYSVNVGYAASAHTQVGIEYRSWLHGWKGDSLPSLELGNVLVTYFPRLQGGPFFEGGTGVSYYSLVQGTGDPIEPVSESTPSSAAGWGWGYTLGAGWDFHHLRPRLTYAHGREHHVHNSSVNVANGWTHDALLFEIGIR